MSFYGDIKRVNSSPFIFDRYYPTRLAMETACASDNVYIGRYVLVKYTCKYNTNGNLITFSKYDENNYSGYEEVALTASSYEANKYYTKSGSTYSLATGAFNSSTKYYRGIKKYTSDYSTNLKTDLNEYKDTFDSTVWQKVYSQGTEKYIMVAELNSDVPKLDFETVIPKYFSSNKEKWRVPSVYAASDDAYVLAIPDILHLDVGTIDDNFYAKDLTDPKTRYQMRSDGTSTKNASGTSSATILSHDDMLSPAYNYTSWENYLNNVKKTTTTGDIDEKRLEMKLYAFGQAISDIYDVLYGVPNGGTGDRPFYTDKDISNLLGTNEKGLIGILSSIATEAKGDGSVDLYGRKLKPGQYYYFLSKWGSAEEDSTNFIENIPEVIGASYRPSTESHYYINFDNPTYTYEVIQLTSNKYKPNKYYIKNNDNTFSIATDESFDNNIKYYNKIGNYIKKF